MFYAYTEEEEEKEDEMNGEVMLPHYLKNAYPEEEEEFEEYFDPDHGHIILEEDHFDNGHSHEHGHNHDHAHLMGHGHSDGDLSH